MSEDHIIRNCAPTLAGIKTGNIFTCPCESRQRMLIFARDLNLRLRNKGLRCIPLSFSRGRALIYLYRPSRLRSDLDDACAASLLRSHGYAPENCDGCVVQLVRRLQAQGDFPHEIGLFLGYPPEDVLGFMENRAGGCKCAGCWKVYGDPEAAKEKFAQYKTCTQVYRDLYARGHGIERLAVAG